MIKKRKIQERCQIIYLLNANGLIYDDELATNPMNNFERGIEYKAMSWALLSLIFFECFCWKSHD